VLNSVKHNVDDIYNLPNSNTDSRLTELLALTLGFKVRRNYDQKQLSALVAALPRILRYKGTEEAVNMAGNALIAASGASGDFKSEVNGGELTVTLPVELIDISLFIDLLEYILPAGMTYRIERMNKKTSSFATKVLHDTRLIAEFVPELDQSSDTDEKVGLANIYEVGTTEPSFTNFRRNEDDTDDIVNIGLLDNSIIPSVTEAIKYQEPRNEEK
jgi:hypothetical protein